MNKFSSLLHLPQQNQDNCNFVDKHVQIANLKKIQITFLLSYVMIAVYFQLLTESRYIKIRRLEICH